MKIGILEGWNKLHRSAREYNASALRKSLLCLQAINEVDIFFNSADTTVKSALPLMQQFWWTPSPRARRDERRFRVIPYNSVTRFDSYDALVITDIPSDIEPDVDNLWALFPGVHENRSISSDTALPTGSSQATQPTGSSQATQPTGSSQATHLQRNLQRASKIIHYSNEQHEGDPTHLAPKFLDLPLTKLRWENPSPNVHYIILEGGSLQDQSIPDAIFMATNGATSADIHLFADDTTSIGELLSTLTTTLGTKLATQNLIKRPFGSLESNLINASTITVVTPNRLTPLAATLATGGEERVRFLSQM